MAKCKGKTLSGSACSRNAKTGSDYCCLKHDPNNAVTVKKDWYQPFLEAFQDFGMVTRACRTAKIGRTTFYDALKSDPEFAEAYEFIEQEVTEELEEEARRRAQDGVTKVNAHGEFQEYSDTLLIFLLKARRPDKYRERVDIRHGGKVNLTPEDAPDLSNPDRESEVNSILAESLAAANGAGRN